MARTAIRVIQRLELCQRDIAGRGVDLDLEGERAVRAANAALDHTIALVEKPDLVARVVRGTGQVEPGAAIAADLERERRFGAFLVLTKR